MVLFNRNDKFKLKLQLHEAKMRSEKLKQDNMIKMSYLIDLWINDEIQKARKAQETKKTKR